MTNEEYKKHLNQIELRYAADKKDLAKEYIISNNPYKVGDIVEDHIGKGEIIEIKCAIDHLCCVYNCINLTKNGTQNKHEPYRIIWQSNILKKDEE